MIKQTTDNQRQWKCLCIEGDITTPAYWFPCAQYIPKWIVWRSKKNNCISQFVCYILFHYIRNLKCLLVRYFEEKFCYINTCSLKVSFAVDSMSFCFWNNYFFSRAIWQVKHSKVCVWWIHLSKSPACFQEQLLQITKDKWHWVHHQCTILRSWMCRRCSRPQRLVQRWGWRPSQHLPISGSFMDKRPCGCRNKDWRISPVFLTRLTLLSAASRLLTRWHMGHLFWFIIVIIISMNFWWLFIEANQAPGHKHMLQVRCAILFMCVHNLGFWVPNVQ